MSTDASGRRIDVTDKSVGDLVSALSEDTSRLMRQEIALAKAETRAEAKDIGMGVARLALAGVLGVVIIMLVSLAAAVLLSEWMALELAYLVVAAIWAGVAGFLAMTGRNKLKEASPMPERTAASLKEIPDTLKGSQA